MLTVGKKIILVGRFDEGDGYYATEALCRHMRWPLAYGGKVKDDCITCPLHQTTHNIESGELIEWSPFPLFPPYVQTLSQTLPCLLGNKNSLAYLVHPEILRNKCATN